MPRESAMMCRLCLAVALAVGFAASGAAQQASVYDQPAYGSQQAPAPTGPNAYPGQVPGQTPGGPPTGAPPAQPAGPPFQLEPVEQQFVMQVLQMWESRSGEIKTFHADFERLEYDSVWGPGRDKPLIKSTGTLSYSKPDKGSFKIDKISRWTKNDPKNTAPDAAGDYVEQKQEIGEHWVCDGKAVFEYNHRNKQVVETPIPEEMRGQSIVDGPLPFLFGAQAQKLMQRYWIRSKQGNPEQIWLEAYPRQQVDAANYDSVEVMLDRKTMQPTAIQVHLPGGQQRHVYMFRDAKVNATMEAWFGKLFSATRAPIGWTRVVASQEPQGPPAGPQAANPQAPLQR